MKLVTGKKLWTFVSIGIALVAIFLLVSSLSPLEFSEGHVLIFGEPETAPASQSDTQIPNPIESIDPFWSGALTIVFWVLVPLSILYIIISRQARKRVLRDILIVSLLFLFLYFLFQWFNGNAPGNEAEVAPPAAQSDAPETVIVPGDFAIDPPEWLALVSSFLLIALVILFIAFLWFRLRPTGVNEEQSTLELLVDEAQETLQNLRSGGNLKDTVIRCYHDMCMILAEHQGVRRRRAMTPREFQDHLSKIGLANDHIERLTKLFETVRYGGQSSTQSTAREAELCLETIVESYERAS